MDKPPGRTMVRDFPAMSAKPKPKAKARPRTKTARRKTKTKPKVKDRSKGKRYTEAEKKKVLNFVEQVNKTKGRGGITAAVKEFKITALTISNWMKKASPLGISTGRVARSKDVSGVLKELADLHEKIAACESELNELQREYRTLKNKL